MSFSEKVGAFYQRASNALYDFSVKAKESMIKAGNYISETSSKVYAAVLPHFTRFKEAAMKFFSENKRDIGFGAIVLGIGAAIGAAIAYLVKGKAPATTTPATTTPATTTTTPTTTKTPPAGGVQVLPTETPKPLVKAPT